MSNRFDQLAAAVASELNAAEPGAYSEPFIAAARYVVRWELKELFDQVRVSVTPRSMQRAILSRSTDATTYQVDVALQTRCKPDDAPRVAELVGLTDQIERRLNRRALAGMPEARFLGSSLDPLYLPDLLHEQRVFTAILTLRYMIL